ncbi:MAG: YggS family pyridoxal phosphate-dependent enzyme [Spirochaetaceae bacterium]|nr:YggS family pyridoxal phosphate-dependent enzyme [Spirochaetaceae bacterium]
MENNILFKTVQDNIDSVLEEIASAAKMAGRDPSEIKLMAVTKTKPLEYAEAAYRAGIRLFGENRVQEMEEKFKPRSESGTWSFHNDAEIHFIGHLQRNKVKKALAIACAVDSIDKYETAEEISKCSKALGKTTSILIEYNTSGEQSKSGFENEKELFESIDKIRNLDNLDIKGFMTIAPFTDDEKAIRESFRMLANLFRKVETIHPDLKMDTLSMGMSSDFKIAIEEGSNIIRVGTRLFGSRN